MSFVRRLLLVALILSAATAWGQSSTNQPQIGYLYPSGGQQGTVVQITAGGQFLRGADEVYVSGEGVRASVVQYIRPLRNLQSEQRQLLQSRLKEVRQMRLAELSGKRPGRAVATKRAPAKRAVLPSADRSPATSRAVRGMLSGCWAPARGFPAAAPPERPQD